jgi:hypothetical protein
MGSLNSTSLSGYRPVIGALPGADVSRENCLPLRAEEAAGYTRPERFRGVRTDGYTLPQPDGGTNISYTSVLLAVVVGIAHAGLAPEIEVAGVRPNLMLVAVVLVTALLGLDRASSGLSPAA